MDENSKESTPSPPSSISSTPSSPCVENTPIQSSEWITFKCVPGNMPSEIVQLMPSKGAPIYPNHSFTFSIPSTTVDYHSFRSLIEEHILNITQRERPVPFRLTYKNKTNENIELSNATQFDSLIAITPENTLCITFHIDNTKGDNGKEVSSTVENHLAPRDSIVMAKERLQKTQESLKEPSPPERYQSQKNLETITFMEKTDINNLDPRKARSNTSIRTIHSAEFQSPISTAKNYLSSEGASGSSTILVKPNDLQGDAKMKSLSLEDKLLFSSEEMEKTSSLSQANNFLAQAPPIQTSSEETPKKETQKLQENKSTDSSKQEKKGIFSRIPIRIRRHNEEKNEDKRISPTEKTDSIPDIFLLKKSGRKKEVDIISIHDDSPEQMGHLSQLNESIHIKSSKQKSIPLHSMQFAEGNDAEYSRFQRVDPLMRCDISSGNQSGNRVTIKLPPLMEESELSSFTSSGKTLTRTSRLPSISGTKPPALPQQPTSRQYLPTHPVQPPQGLPHSTTNHPQSLPFLPAANRQEESTRMMQNVSNYPSQASVMFPPQYVSIQVDPSFNYALQSQLMQMGPWPVANSPMGVPITMNIPIRMSIAPEPSSPILTYPNPYVIGSNPSVPGDNYILQTYTSIGQKVLPSLSERMPPSLQQQPIPQAIPPSFHNVPASTNTPNTTLRFPSVNPSSIPRNTFTNDESSNDKSKGGPLQKVPILPQLAHPEKSNDQSYLKKHLSRQRSNSNHY